LLSIDGTGYFCSSSIHCKHCLERKIGGKTQCHHQAVAAVLTHPETKEVIPLAVEPIIKQDGKSKNDCVSPWLEILDRWRSGMLNWCGHRRHKIFPKTARSHRLRPSTGGEKMGHYNVTRRIAVIVSVIAPGASMRNRIRTCTVAAFLIATTGCGNETAREAPTEVATRFGRPSLAHIAEHTQPEALAAFEQAKRFLLDSNVDTSELDLFNPELSHWCPPQAVYYDWLVNFPPRHPTSWLDKAFRVAVLNDGTCWVWQPPSTAEIVQ